MKKFLTLLLLAVSAISSYAYDVCIDGIYYNLVPKAKQAQVTNDGSDSYGGTYSGDIVIPEKITSGGVEYSVTEITGQAFISCYLLTSIKIPNSVTSIGGSAFNGCSSLTSIQIPNSVTSIGRSAFLYCSSLTSIQIPNSVTSIGDAAFAYCNSLTSIKIPNSVTSIGDYAFQYCSSLTSIQIPNSVTSIGDRAFEDCSSLTSIQIPNSVTSIGDHTFSGCRSLTSIQIPNSVTRIGDSAFGGCWALTSIQIPNSVTSIGDAAFTGCRSLTSIQIPNSVTSIGIWAFEGCSSLTSIQIPNSVTSIGEYTFFNCENLANITLGTGIQYIYNQAFANCPNLKNVYCNAVSVPSTETDAFEGSYIEYANLYVPAESLSSYRNTPPWSSFGNISALTATVPEDIDFVDGEEYTNVIEKTCNTLTYTRDFSNINWQALYVPFSIPVSVLEEKGLKVAELNDTHQKDNDGDGIADETTVEFFTLTSGETLPNYPYMIKADEAGEVEIELEDATLYASATTSIDCSTVKQVFTFTGTYTGVKGEDMFNNNFYALAGGCLARTEDNTISLKPQRWYMNVANRDGSPVRYYAPSVRFSVDGFEEEGMQTMISEVTGTPAAEDAIYTLDGMRIAGGNPEALKPGLYLQGGKKFVVK